MMVVTRYIQVQGMVGKEDVKRVLDALHDVWGIREANVNLSEGVAYISYNEEAASFHDFQQAVLDQGFEIVTEDGKVEEKKVEGAPEQDIVEGNIEEREV